MIQYDPLGIFEQNPAKGGVCEIKQVRVSTAAATPVTLVAAVSGKKIRVLSLQAFALTAHTYFDLTSFGLNEIFSGWALYQNTAFWKNYEFGLCDSNTGQSLAVTPGAGSVTTYSLRYIEVVP